jgi:hypothetical protein
MSNNNYAPPTPGIILLPLLLMLAIGTSHGIPRQLQPGLNAPTPNCVSPTEAVDSFLRAVDRGELVLFLTTLQRDDITPTGVEYLYEFDSHLPTITVRVDLKVPMAVPGEPGLEVRSVTAVLGYEGDIVETRAHVYARDTQ